MKNMQKGFMPVLVLVIVVAVIIGGIFAFKGSSTSTNEQATTTDEISTMTDDDSMMASSTSSAEVSMKELVAMGRPQKCTFKQTVENSTSEGVIYISGSKMRGDFTSMSQGMTATSHMINDSKDVYIWSDGMTQGVKMSIAATTGTKPTADTMTPNMDLKLGYNCAPWSADSTSFTVPASVTFSALGQ